MIQAIVLDIDGVIIGNKKGFNWPLPNVEVLSTLKKLCEEGIVVSLCTSKGTFAAKEIIEKAHLDNLHIGDGGAVIVDFIKNKTFEINFIEKDFIKKLVTEFQKNNIYLELYNSTGYFIDKKTASNNLRSKHAKILYQQPKIVDNLLDKVDNIEIVKIMPIPKNENEKNIVIDIFQSFKKDLTLQWGVHPTAHPAEFGAITKKGISKGESVKKIFNFYKIPLKNILGVGDGMTDWGFIKLCGYKGIMGNSSEELKKALNQKDKNSFTGTGVNENGLLSIFKYFKLI